MGRKSSKTPNIRIRIIEIKGGRNRSPKYSSGARKVIIKVAIIKAVANPIPPSLGTSPVCIFLSSILSYQDFLWDKWSTSATIIKEKKKEEKIAPNFNNIKKHAPQSQIHKND
ncbi:MAG: hypothetical protein LBP93_02020 [Treponema sp.]|jgi:hypothetical protein|nr:hypothetical protein [Treponema sp.]